MTEGQKELTALIVDNDSKVAYSLATILGLRGVKSTHVLTTAEALELLKRETYDFVFTNFRQEPNGIAVYEAARAKGIESRITTAQVEDELLSQAQSVAGKHLIRKPYPIQLIFTVIDDYRQRKPQS